MVLTLNVGNTRITLGVYDADKLVLCASLATRLGSTADEYAIKLDNILRLHGVAPAQIDGAILGSVVPALTAPLTLALHLLCPVRVLTVGPGLKSGLQICIDNPAQLGAELLCSTVAALERAPAPLLMLHADTAISIMAVNRHQQLFAGVILPAPATSLRILVERTAQLPQVDLNLKNPTILATNTQSCLQSGLILGTAAMLDGLIAQYENELGKPLSVLATGSLPRAVLSACQKPIQWQETLVSDGLYAVWRKNRR